MFFIFPTGVETLERHRPWMNWLIMGATVGMFFWSGMGDLKRPDVQSLMLTGWDLKGLAGHLLLHAGWMHLIGNMVFLWVFGNVICQTTGNFIYLLLYFAAGFGAGSIHLIMDGNPAVGASGAISGLTGLTLAMFPLNGVSFFYVLGVHGGTFDGKVWGLCVISVLWDLIGTAIPGGQTAHWAHIGGLVCGMLLGLLFLGTGWVRLSCFDNRSLFEMLTGRELNRSDDEVEATAT